MSTSNNQSVIAGLTRNPLLLSVILMKIRIPFLNGGLRVKPAMTGIFLFLFCSVFSQQKFQPELSIGVNSGLISSSMDFIPAVKQSNLLGYNGGISARFISEKHFGLQTELNFSQRGWKADSVLASRTLYYIELPLLTHLYFGQKKVRFVINLGPKIAYLLSEKSDNLKNELNTKGWRKLDYGLCGGGGFEFHTQKLAYVIEGRYYYGLSDIFPNGKSDDFSRSANRNISVNFTVFWGL